MRNTRKTILARDYDEWLKFIKGFCEAATARTEKMPTRLQSFSQNLAGIIEGRLMEHYESHRIMTRKAVLDKIYNLNSNLDIEGATDDDIRALKVFFAHLSEDAEKAFDAAFNKDQPAPQLGGRSIS